VIIPPSHVLLSAGEVGGRGLLSRSTGKAQRATRAAAPHRRHPAALPDAADRPRARSAAMLADSHGERRARSWWTWRAMTWARGARRQRAREPYACRATIVTSCKLVSGVHGELPHSAMPSICSAEALRPATWWVRPRLRPCRSSRARAGESRLVWRHGGLLRRPGDMDHAITIAHWSSRAMSTATRPARYRRRKACRKRARGGVGQDARHWCAHWSSQRRVVKPSLLLIDKYESFTLQPGAGVPGPAA